MRALLHKRACLEAPEGKEDFLSQALTQLGQCQVRSGTEHPCRRPAVAKIRGVPFCESCAREQEDYFAIGELTEDSRLLRDDERIVGMLYRMRRGQLLGRRVSGEREPESPIRRLPDPVMRSFF